MLLRALLLLFVLACAFSEAAEPAGTLSAPEAWAQVQTGDMVLVDIRQPEEWRQTGRAQHAVGISMLHPEGGEGFVRDLLAATGGRRDAPIVLICRTGNRTGQVQRALAGMGFTQVFHIPEGMIGSGFGPGWMNRGLPVEDCRSC